MNTLCINKDDFKLLQYNINNSNQPSNEITISQSIFDTILINLLNILHCKIKIFLDTPTKDSIYGILFNIDPISQCLYITDGDILPASSFHIIMFHSIHKLIQISIEKMNSTTTFLPSITTTIPKRIISIKQMITFLTKENISYEILDNKNIEIMNRLLWIYPYTIDSLQGLTTNHDFSIVKQRILNLFINNFLI